MGLPSRWYSALEFFMRAARFSIMIADAASDRVIVDVHWQQ
jgi:hypothetical protein